MDSKAYFLDQDGLNSYHQALLGNLPSPQYLLKAPVGVIVWWSGSADNIPAGWNLCDGTNGTIDLRDKFILAAGTAHNIGETGGEETHTLTVKEMAQHAHTYPVRYASGATINTTTNKTNFAVNGTGGTNGSNNVASSGSNEPHNNMPPYYTLCAIQKLTADETDGITMEQVNTAIEVALGNRSNPNLLDNWFFQNPINQRRVSDTISTPGYFIDRWKLVSGTVKITPEGLYLNGIIEQVLEKSVGANVTASAAFYDKVARNAATYDDAQKTFRISATNAMVLAAKLEIGDDQTLYFLNGDLRDPPPNPTLELIKCQRYLQIHRHTFFTPYAVGELYLDKRIDMPFSLAVPMRNVPTMTPAGIFALQYNNVYVTGEVAGTDSVIRNITAPRWSDHQCCTLQIVYDKSYSSGASIDIGQLVILESGLNESSLTFSAEL